MCTFGVQYLFIFRQKLIDNIDSRVHKPASVALQVYYERGYPFLFQPVESFFELFCRSYRETADIDISDFGSYLVGYFDRIERYFVASDDKIYRLFHTPTNHLYIHLSTSSATQFFHYIARLHLHSGYVHSVYRYYTVAHKYAHFLCWTVAERIYHE